MKEMCASLIKAVGALGLYLSFACAIAPTAFAEEPGAGIENRVDSGESVAPRNGAGDHETLKMLSECLAQAALNNPGLESAFIDGRRPLRKFLK